MKSCEKGKIENFHWHQGEGGDKDTLDLLVFALDKDREKVQS